MFPSSTSTEIEIQNNVLVFWLVAQILFSYFPGLEIHLGNNYLDK